MFKSKHQQSYKQLAERPFWRLFKVGFGLFSLWLIIYASVTGWQSECPPEGSAHLFNFVPQSACSKGTATANAVGSGIVALLVVICLFLAHQTCYSLCYKR